MEQRLGAQVAAALGKLVAPFMPEMQRARYRYRALFHQRADNPPYWAASIARFSRLALMSRRSDSPITPSPFLSRREKSASYRAMNWALVVSRDGLSWLIRSGTGHRHIDGLLRQL